MSSPFPGAIPEIPVNDIRLALDYYANSLGFAVDWQDEALGLAGISKGDCRLFLATAEYRKEYGNAGPAMTWLNLKSNDEVNDLHRAWVQGKALVISAPEPKSWGIHEFTAQDLDGNLLRVFHDFRSAERAALGHR